MKQFDCSSCGSICCINPPMLGSFDEIVRAQRFGAEIVALEKMPGKYVVAIAKNTDTDTCPFLTKKGCSIYENRFNACRSYECGLLGASFGSVVSSLARMDLSKLNIHDGPTSDPFFVSKSTLKKLGIRPAKYHEALQKTVLSNQKTFILHVVDTIEKIAKQEEFA